MSDAVVTARPLHVPYITSWSAEVDPPGTVIVAGDRRGIAYADEQAVDRDTRGVLWQRAGWQPGAGRPLLGKVHPVRQRHAMRRLLCQVCAGPADRSDDGVLWVDKDFRGDWLGWPDGVATPEPPICLRCLHLSVRLCPALRTGSVAMRVRSFPVVAVRGARYVGVGSRAIAIDDATVALDDPAVRWVRAANLIRQLSDCTLIENADVPLPQG